MASGSAVVKAVLSGDTVILMGRAQGGPPPELQLSLASLQAPKLARGPQMTDEPFGWQSREYLRNLVIGKRVEFRVDYKVAAINRDFGTITLEGENVGKTVVRHGWATVRGSDENRAEKSPDFDELVSLQAQAQQEKIGIWTEDATARQNAVRNVQWSGYNPQELFGRYSKTPIRAIVEFVRDGSSLRCLLVEPMIYIGFFLAGIQCPKVGGQKQGADGTEVIQPEPFALQAKYFTEIRLLHRELDIVIEGIDRNGNFFGTVLHPSGNVAVELLKNGFARLADWSAAFTTKERRDALKNAEREAKAQRKNIWQSYVPPAVTESAGGFDGVCVEVVSGDQIIVLVKNSDGTSEERRIALASTRAPKPGNPRTNQADEPWAAEAKEYLRNRLIGKKVSVHIDYQREIPRGEHGGVDRTFATVTYGKAKNNIAEQLIADGLATPVRHKQDEQKATDYDSLLAAEQAAKAAKKRIHSTQEAPITRINDVSTDSKRAKQLIPLLQRQRNLRGLIDYVFTGSRYKVLIPTENCAIQLAMSVIRCPNVGRAGDGKTPGRAAEPFGEEAKAFSREKIMQRFVEIEIDDMDRNGVALGRIYVGQGDHRRNFAADLLEAGLARIDSRAAERRVYDIEVLQQREADARTAGRGVWSIPEETETKESEPQREQAVDEVMPVRVSEIVDGVHFYVHSIDSTALAAIQERMIAFTQEHGTQGGPVNARPGATCAALFDDGTGLRWFRARIEEASPATQQVRVVYVDYGNRAVLPLGSLRSLDSSFFAVPAQARECVFAYMKAPPSSDEASVEAGLTFNELAWGKDLVAQVHWKDDQNRLAVSLHKGDNVVSIGEALLSQGLARISKPAARISRRHSPRAQALLERLQEAEDLAHRDHLGLWRYGDVGDSDDEDFRKF